MLREFLLFLLLISSVCSAQVTTGGLHIPGDDAVQVVRKTKTVNSDGLILKNLVVYFARQTETPALGVYKWFNEGEWGGYASQSVEVNKPAYDSANKCWVYSDTTRHTLKTEAWPTNTTNKYGTFFIVQKFVSGSYATSFWSTNMYCRWLYDNGNSFLFSQGSGFTNCVVAQTPMDSNIHVLTSVQDLANDKAYSYLDGVKQNEIALADSEQKKMGSPYAWHLGGGLPANPYGMNGNIYSIAFYDRVLSDAEVLLVSSALLKVYKP